MTDIEFDDFGQAGDDPGGGEIEAVPGMTSSPWPRASAAACLDARKFVSGPLGLSMREGVAPGAGMSSITGAPIAPTPAPPRKMAR